MRRLSIIKRFLFLRKAIRTGPLRTLPGPWTSTPRMRRPTLLEGMPIAKKVIGTRHPDCTRALELNPQDAMAYFNRGFAYGRKADWDRAIADLTGGWRSTVKTRTVTICEGLSTPGKVIGTGSLPTTPAPVTQASSRLYQNRGQVDQEKGDFYEAIADYTGAWHLRPAKLAGSIQQSAELLDKSGKPKEALEAYQSFLKSAPPQAKDSIEWARERIKALGK